MPLEWKELQYNTWAFYDTENGEIKGKITTTGRKDTYFALVNNVFLGEYISFEHAKQVVENPPENKNTPQPYYQEVRP